jgi:hypothetical protein
VIGENESRSPLCTAPAQFSMSCLI